MTPENALRMTLPRAINMDTISGGFSRDKFEAFAELHRLKDEVYQFISAKYLDDQRGLVRSIAYLNKLAQRKAGLRGGRNRKVLHRACLIAIGQHVKPGKFGALCYQCHGSGNSEPGVTCGVCEGTRFAHWPDEWYAGQLEVSVDDYRNTWRRIIDQLFTLAGFWEDDMWKEWNGRLE